MTIERAFEDEALGSQGEKNRTAPAWRLEGRGFFAAVGGIGQFSGSGAVGFDTEKRGGEGKTTFLKPTGKSKRKRRLW